MDYFKPVLDPLPAFEVKCAPGPFVNDARRAYLERGRIVVGRQVCLVSRCVVKTDAELDVQGRWVIAEEFAITFQPLRDCLSLSVGICR